MATTKVVPTESPTSKDFASSPLVVALRAGEVAAQQVKASRLITVYSMIWYLRDPEALTKHEAEKAAYEKKAKTRKQVKHRQRTLFTNETVEGDEGFWTLVDGHPVFTKQPKPPGVGTVFRHDDYDRSYGFTTHAKDYGLLADPLFNRDIRNERVEQYADEMRAGL